jgi:SecD/SecF fusion protein
MQGKGFVKLFASLLLLIVIYQTALLFPIWSVESAADAQAEQAVAAKQYTPEEAVVIRSTARQQYLDSVSSESVFFGFTYQNLKRQQLALGLDLKGGMSVVLQVDLRDLLYSLSGESKNIDFTKAITRARELQKSSQSDFATLFAQAFKEVAPSSNLASIFGPARKLKDINTESTDAQVLAAIRTEAQEAVRRTNKLLKERIDRLGVAQPTVSLDESTDRITIELPGITNPQRAREYLQTTASLEFWDTYRLQDVVGSTNLGNMLIELNESLKDKTVTIQIDSSKKDSTGKTIIDTIKTASAGVDSANVGPLFSKLQLVGGVTIGLAAASDTAEVMAILTTNAAKLPRNARFVWSNKYEKEEATGIRKYVLYCLDTKGKTEAPLQGDRIVAARMDTDTRTAGYVVVVNMNDEGKREWKKMTERNSVPENKAVAIVLDNKVYSAPVVNGVIADGNTQISGNFTAVEAGDLANILSIGKLPCRTEIIEEAIVGPSLGEATVRAGLIALLVGFLSGLVFMLGYYSFAGFISIIALMFNLLIIISCLASFGTVLTLPGIAGIVLTIGMAVDANVIIFERIREGLRKGESWTVAMNKGFEQSYSSIIDANITTLLVAIILFYFGLGPIKGFATVLIVGVISSVFTAVFFGRTLFDYFGRRKQDAADAANAGTSTDAELVEAKPISVGSAATINVLANPGMNFIGKRYLAYAFSGILIAAGLVSIFTRGFDLGVDFQGGRSYVLEFEKEVDNEALKTKVIAAMDGYDKVIIKTFNQSSQVKVTTSYLQAENAENTDALVLEKIHKAATEYSGSTISLADFTAQKASPQLKLNAVSKVGASVADDIRSSAYTTAIIAMLGIFLYILFRFRRWQYSAGATLALMHDVLIVIGLFSLLKGILPFSLEVNQEFIAAILTIIGYSINDTVIVFDRIRESLREEENKGKSLAVVINDAVNNTLSRTFMTSFTTLLVVILLFIFGGDGVRGFAFALLVGIGFGTYSSIYIASPLIVDFTNDAAKMTEDEEDYVPEYVKVAAAAAAAAEKAAKEAEDLAAREPKA